MTSAWSLKTILLFTKWILDPNSSGINVIYDPGDAALYDSMGNPLTTVPIDTHMYAFDGTTTAREAPSNYNDLYTFLYWGATTEDGVVKQFHTGSPVDLSDLVASDTLYDENGDLLRKTVTLKAVYDVTGDPNRITTITFDGNTFSQSMYDGSTEELQGKANDGTNRVTVTLDKEVNQTIELPGADDFYLDGWELVGWSFTKGTYEEQVAGAAADSDAPNLEPEQKVAADNLVISTLNDEENTLYAMWQPKKYNVTVRQVIEEGVPVNSFTYPWKRGVESELGNATQRSTTLNGNSSFVEEDFEYYPRTGDVINVTTPTIPDSASYSVRVNATVTRDDGTVETLDLTDAGNYSIMGDVVITYTYSMKEKVTLRKRDATDHQKALLNAEFTFTPVEFNTTTNRWENAGAEQTLVASSATNEWYLQEGTYRITESVAPDNYANIGTDLYLTVDKDSRFRLFVASGADVSAEVAELDSATGKILTVYDKPLHTVTLKKLVDGETTDQGFEFMVTLARDGSGVGSYAIGQLTDGTSIVTNNVGEANITLVHDQEVGLQIPHGCTLMVVENEYPRYETSHVWQEGELEPSDPVAGSTFESDPITDDAVLTYTNKLKAVKVTLVKVGVNNYDETQTEEPLSGATFTLYTQQTGGSVAKDASGAELRDKNTDSQGVFYTGELVPGTYYLEETVVPDGYIAPLGRFKLVVTSPDEPPQILSDWVTGESTGAAGTVTGDATEGYTITVRNIAGAELPKSGGHGTEPYVVVGAAMVIAAGLSLLSRARRRNA